MTLTRWTIVAVPVVVVLAAAGWLLYPSTGSGARTAAAGPPAPSAHVVGVAGCSGANCHGGPLTAKDSSPSSFAATLWRENDRHARAFAALFGDSARRI